VTFRMTHSLTFRWERRICTLTLFTIGDSLLVGEVQDEPKPNPRCSLSVLARKQNAKKKEVLSDHQKSPVWHFLWYRRVSQRQNMFLAKFRFLQKNGTSPVTGFINARRSTALIWIETMPEKFLQVLFVE